MTMSLLSAKKKKEEKAKVPFALIPTESQDLQNGADDDGLETEMRGLLSSLFLSPKYSDLTIVCGNETFSAHRNIVCPRSNYFARACDGNFKEALSREIELPDREPVLVKKTLEFLYTGDYTHEGRELISYAAGEPAAANNDKATTPSSPEGGLEPSNNGTSATAASAGDSQLKTTTNSKPSLFGSPALSLSCFHVLMYAEADYFQVDRLKAMAKKKFRASFMDKPDRKSFQVAVMEVYRSTAEYDRGLKDVVIALTRSNLVILRGGIFPVLADDLLRSVPEFAVDLCIATLGKYVDSQIQNPRQPSSSSVVPKFDFNNPGFATASTTPTTTSSSSNSSSSSTGLFGTTGVNSGRGTSTANQFMFSNINSGRGTGATSAFGTGPP